MTTRVRSAATALAIGALLAGCAPADAPSDSAAAVVVASEAPQAMAISVPVIAVPADAPGPNSGGLLTVIPPPPPPPPPPVAQGGEVASDRGATTSRQAPPRTAPAESSGGGAAPAAGPASESGFASGLFSAVNNERAGHGLGALASSSCAAGYARSWAEHIATTGEWGHQDVGRVMSGCGAMAAGENIARGTSSVSETVAAWMASPGHRANILDGGYTHGAVASVRSADGRIVSVQIFLTL